MNSKSKVVEGGVNHGFGKYGYYEVDKLGDNHDLFCSLVRCETGSDRGSYTKDKQLECLSYLIRGFELKFVTVRLIADEASVITKILNYDIQHSDAVLSEKEALIGAGKIKYNEDPKRVFFDSSSCREEFGYDKPKDNNKGRDLLNAIEVVSDEIWQLSSDLRSGRRI